MVLRIVKSAAVAMVTGVVCANTYLLALMTVISLRRPSFGAVVFDVVSMFRQDVRLWVVLVSTFCLAAAYCFRTLNRGLPLPLPLIAATSSFLATAAACGLFLSAVLARSSHQDMDRFWALSLGMWSTDIGTFGFFAGLAGGAWLAQRRARIRSIGRLVWEAAAAGAPLGAVLALLLVSSGTPPASSLQILVLSLFFALPGSVCAVLVALALRRRIVASGRA